MLIPGLDGRKMSKSYNNEIPFLAEEKALRKKIMSITTDSTPLEEPKELDGTLVGILYALFATPEQYKDLESRLAAGGLGWGHAKDELFGIINESVREIRSRYNELRGDEELLKTTLCKGAEKARAIATPVLERVRNAVGIK
jgi:tryptophanyl-tRNA synthetase